VPGERREAGVGDGAGHGDPRGRHVAEEPEGVVGGPARRVGAADERHGAEVRDRAEGVGVPGVEAARKEASIVIYEVMVEELDAGWWKQYRGRLEERFRQETVVVRAQEVRVL
jgi:hypothetical protein